MGGVVEGAVGIADKTSPRRAAIEKVHVELRQGYEIRDKTKRELEFLLEGGDPLELECGNVSICVQSTSCTDRHADQFVTSEAKGSFGCTASPYGDSIESSGTLGKNPCGPNSADNLLLFDAEREFSEGNRTSLHRSRSNIASTEKLSHTHGDRRTGKLGVSVAFGLPKKAYRRRYRSQPNRDGTRSSSTDVIPIHGGDGSSLLSRHGPRDDKELLSNVENWIISSNSKPTSPLDDTLHRTGLMDSQQDIELDCIKPVESAKDLTECFLVNATSDAIACESPVDDQRNQQSLLGVLGTPIQMDSDGPEARQAMEAMAFAKIECQPGVTAIEVENKSSSCQMNGFSSKMGDGMKDDGNNGASCGMKRLDSEPSCTQTSRSIDGNSETEMCTKMRITGSNGQMKDQTSEADKIPIPEGDESLKEKKETGGTDSSTLVNVESSFACQSQRENGVKLQPDEELFQSESALASEVKDQIVSEEMEAYRLTGSESGRKSPDPSVDKAGLNNENSCTVRHQDSTDLPIPYLHGVGSLMKASTVSPEGQTSLGSDLKLARKIDEDSILKEAQIIEAKRKRIAELCIAPSPKQIRLKSHWDYVLEEMAWLANDFAQERVWKVAAAAQLSSRAAFTCCLRKQENIFHLEGKKVAHTLAKSIMEFWQSVEETSKVLDWQSQRDDEHSVQTYAVRFRKYNNCDIVYNQAEVPLTTDRVSDMGILDPSWEDNLTEDNLFYTVLPGTMETYRSSIESRVAQCQRIATGVLEEAETSACDAAADFETQDDGHGEDERETNTYDTLMAFEDRKSSRFVQKKQKHLIHAYGVKSYDASSGISHMQGAENKVVHQSALLVQRSGDSNLSIPTKRVRTASRRVISPFSAGTSFLQVPSKTDASSGDTNSFQDDQSTLCGGSRAPYSLEVESVGKFEKQLPIESAEVSTKHKKKKAKHSDAPYEARWQVDPTFQNEQFQRDQLRKSRQFESNCSSGLLGQPMAKKPKTMWQSQDSSFEIITPIGGSAPSPVASQMSNMSNPNIFIKMLGGRDRGRKPKGLKLPAGQPGSGTPWTLFEDQALVVLAHDLGPNWELVSDAINSTLHFKCMFRKAKECKERHHFLMDRISGDGADSAEDSGSSQPYPSTLPGIPKGSARQLFQRLQGPMEEDTLKSHFEKIIIIGQKQLYHKTQNDDQDPKQLQQPHSSHTIGLSQVCPNNLNGGPILTPLDLCDTTTAGTDILPLGYQGPHSGGLAIPDQGTMTPMHPESGTSSGLQGSPSIVVGSNFSSSPPSLNFSARGARYGLPRSASLSFDEQQRMQQYNQMISSRSVPQPNISASRAHPGVDGGVHMPPGGTGMGLVSGVNRSMPMARPGFQGIASSCTVNSGSMVSSGMPPANMHLGVGSGQGSSMMRPREALHMPGLDQDLQRPMMPDLQIPHFGGLSSPYPNQAPSPPVPSYALHHPPSHPVSPQQPQVLSSHHHPHFTGQLPNHAPNVQQTYAVRLAKERQQQHCFQQQQMPHSIQSQPQLSMQNNSQDQPQTGSPPVSFFPLDPVNQQKPTQGTVRNGPTGGSGLTNLSNSKRRQRQQFSQANRQHPQRRQQQAQSQSQQPPNKVAKGVGRGNPVMHQNVPVSPSLVNGSINPGQFPSPQKKISSLTKNLHQMTSHSDKSNQLHVPAAASPGQSGSNHQQTPPHQKSLNQNQPVLQRVVQNCQVNTGQLNKLQTRDSGGDQNRLSSSTEMDTSMTLPQTTSSSELLLDPNTLNSATITCSLVSVPSNNNESAGQSQGLGRRPLSASLPSNSELDSQQHQLSSLHSQQQVQLLSGREREFA